MVHQTPPYYSPTRPNTALISYMEVHAPTRGGSNPYAWRFTPLRMEVPTALIKSKNNSDYGNTAHAEIPK